MGFNSGFKGLITYSLFSPELVPFPCLHFFSLPYKFSLLQFRESFRNYVQVYVSVLHMY